MTPERKSLKVSDYSNYDAPAAADDDDGDESHYGVDDDEDVKERAGRVEAVGDLNQQVAPDNVQQPITACTDPQNYHDPQNTKLI